jgi:TetR/AcrR family transcriptional regulator, regulator of cefoperazone and chloramphenicol sensitivity
VFDTSVLMSSSKMVRKRKPGVSEPMAAASTREKLMEAAGHLFAEHGYYATTVRQIVKRSGANVAAVNYHFGDKLGLYTEVLQQSIRAARVDAISGALDQNAPPEEILRAVIRTRLQSVASPKLQDQNFRIMVHELAQPTPALERVIDEVSRPIYERLLELIGQIAGLPSKHEKIRLCTNSIMGQILMYVLAGPLLRKLWPELEMTPEQVDRIAEHIGDFSMTYLRQLNSQVNSEHADSGGRQTGARRKRGEK